MCHALNLNYNIFAKRNHKGLSVENFHRFLNKSVTIAAEERVTTDIFVPVGILDINLNTIPKLVQNNANAALDYLKLTDSSHNFSSSVF